MEVTGVLMVALLMAVGVAAFVLAPAMPSLYRRLMARFRSRADRGFLLSVGLSDEGSLVRALAKVGGRDQRRLAQMRAELPLALQALAGSIGAGQSNRQAFGYVAAQGSGPLNNEMKRVAWELDAGKSMDEALLGLSQRVPLAEMQLLCAAFRIQQRSGGSMQAVLESAAQSVRDSLELQRTLQVKTAQARLSARVVGLMPLALLALLSLVSPGYLGAFFSSAVGVVMFVAALMLDAFGLFLVHRIVSVRG